MPHWFRAGFPHDVATIGGDIPTLPGTFGKVKLGRHILTGERVAVKVLEKLGRADDPKLESECRIM